MCASALRNPAGAPRAGETLGGAAWSELATEDGTFPSAVDWAYTAVESEAENIRLTRECRLLLSGPSSSG